MAITGVFHNYLYYDDDVQRSKRFIVHVMNRYRLLYNQLLVPFENLLYNHRRKALASDVFYIYYNYTLCSRLTMHEIIRCRLIYSQLLVPFEIPFLNFEYIITEGTPKCKWQGVRLACWRSRFDPRSGQTYKSLLKQVVTSPLPNIPQHVLGGNNINRCHNRYGTNTSLQLNNPN